MIEIAESCAIFSHKRWEYARHHRTSSGKYYKIYRVDGVVFTCIKWPQYLFASGPDCDAEMDAALVAFELGNL